MSITDILNELTEEERLLYLSAKTVKDSTFWAHLLNELDKEALDANQTLLTKTMQGDEKAAIIAACKIQAVGWVMSTIDDVLSMVQTVPDQEQED
jgi:hypothetical protein